MCCGDGMLLCLLDALVVTVSERKDAAAKGLVEGIGGVVKRERGRS